MVEGVRELLVKEIKIKGLKSKFHTTFYK